IHSDSDSDSDVEVDRTRKIHVEIKPATIPQDGTKVIAASVDDIKASLSGLALSPPRMRRDNSNGDIGNRRHQAQFRASGRSGSAGNLLDLDFFATTPTSGLMSPISNASNTSAATTPDSTLSTLDLLTGLDGSFSSPYGGPRWSISNDLLQSPTTTSNSLPPPLPEKQRMSMSSVSSNNSLPILPNRPPSRPRRDIPSPSFSDREIPPFPRQDSSSSLTSPFTSSFAMGGSRGPSPLTLGFSDTIPIAAAFTEQANGYFKGTDMTNDVSMNQGDSNAYVFNMQNLIMLIKKQFEKNAAASYFNVDILKYQVKPEVDAGSMPLKLCSYWKCETTCTEIRVDYAYNPTAMENPVPLSDVSLIVPVDGGVTVMQSKPAATWSAERKTALWKLGDITEATGTGSLRAKFELQEGPSRPATLAVKFSSEGTTLSGLDIDLINPSYRLSLVKKRFVTDST
ncbi:putative F-BAR domain only protein 2, partial [Apostichopus japonicus]